MALSLAKPIAFAAALIAAPLAAEGLGADQQRDSQAEAELAADTLAQGHALRAIAFLEGELEEQPGDPALLINLGIAHAQLGNEDDARECFEAVMASRDVIELETAEGSTTDSRRLARRALAMLDRGAFAPAQTDTDRLSLRD